ncbi:MAG: hypothetical protein ACRC3B_19955, partial [Bacteroidia bacterium]
DILSEVNDSVDVPKLFQLNAIDIFDEYLQTRRIDSLRIFFDTLSTYDRCKVQLTEMGKLFTRPDVYTLVKIESETDSFRVISLTVLQDKNRIYVVKFYYGIKNGLSVIEKVEIKKTGTPGPVPQPQKMLPPTPSTPPPPRPKAPIFPKL